jgi:hypothetical protein
MIKKLSYFDISGIITKQYPEYTLIIGKKPEDIFNFFGVEELHGLYKKDCYDNPTNAYIAGLCNVYPDDHNKLFLFLNATRLGNGYKDVLLIMHESMHLSLKTLRDVGGIGRFPVEYSDFSDSFYWSGKEGEAATLKTQLKDGSSSYAYYFDVAKGISFHSKKAYDLRVRFVRDI